MGQQPSSPVQPAIDVIDQKQSIRIEGAGSSSPICGTPVASLPNAIPSTVSQSQPVQHRAYTDTLGQTLDTQIPPPNSSYEDEAHAKTSDTTQLLISWTQSPAQSVALVGSFAPQPLPLTRSTHDFHSVLSLPPGTHQFKFLVDGREEKCSADFDTVLDGEGRLVNYVEVKPDGDSDNVLDWLDRSQGSDDLNTSDFTKQRQMSADGMISVTPDAAEVYTQEIPAHLLPSQQPLNAYPSSGNMDSYLRPITSTTVPSALQHPPLLLPPMLDKTILNIPQSVAVTTSTASSSSTATPSYNDELQVPSQITLNHLFALSIKDGVMGMASTRRYRKKYVTMVYYTAVDH